MTVQIVFDKNADYAAQAEFAAGDIEKALVESGALVVDSGAQRMIAFDGIDKSLGEQAYEVRVALSGRISIVGGDPSGLMYGGLEVAEQIALGKSIQAVKQASGSPFLPERGIKFNIPLDMRTPTYGGAGDAALNNVEAMWDMDFWHEYLDELARDRFNALSLWNLNPFASMVKVEGYEDIALDDVWVTTLKYDDSYNGTGTDTVRPEHWTNYEVVKEITIEEKIEFWNSVMAYARDRGIRIYIFTWNIYTFAEQGKHGITNDIENEITKDYYRKSVAAMVETYPLLAGIGMTAGENLRWESGMEILNEQWLHDTYALGINDVLSKTPERDFKLIHRLHLTDFEICEELYSDFLGDLDYSDKYSVAHMYSSVKPTFMDATFAIKSADEKLYLEVRNDDIYNMRWGDPSFARDYVANMPTEDVKGFFMGSDGYILGKDYSSSDADLQGQLYIKKNWYNYQLFGRLSYDPTLSDEYFKKVFTEHFADFEMAGDLFEATAIAGKIIPQMTRLYYQSGDSAWMPEGCYSHSGMSGFLTVKRFMQSVDAMQDAGCMSISTFAAELAAKGEVLTDLQTPFQVAQALRDCANSVLEKVEQIKTGTKQSKKMSSVEKEFWNFTLDDEAMAYLGLYYADKIEAAVNLRLYNDSKDVQYQQKSIAYLVNALESWKLYAENITLRYAAQQLGRIGFMDIGSLTKEVEDDISIVENWKCRPISAGISISAGSQEDRVKSGK